MKFGVVIASKWIDIIEYFLPHRGAPELFLWAADFLTKRIGNSDMKL